MFKKIITKGLGATALVIGLSFITPATANAGGGIQFHIEGDHGSLTIGHGKRRYYDHDRRWRHKKHRRHIRNVCRPGEAVRTARHFGVRRAHVDRIGRRLIIVEGRKRGRYVTIGFYRKGRHCDVAFVDRGPRVFRHDRRYGRRY